jgi:hypothetical protein
MAKRKASLHVQIFSRNRRTLRTYKAVTPRLSRAGKAKRATFARSRNRSEAARKAAATRRARGK